MTRTLVHGVLVTHGGLGSELLKTAESILGPQTEMTVCGNQDKSHQDLIDSLTGIVREKQSRQISVVFFVDLAAGSCGRAGMTVASQYSDILLVCGTNLAMLIEFLYHRQRVDLSELCQRILAKGKADIYCRLGSGSAPK